MTVTPDSPTLLSNEDQDPRADWDILSLLFIRSSQLSEVASLEKLCFVYSFIWLYFNCFAFQQCLLFHFRKREDIVDLMEPTKSISFWSI